MSSNRPIDPWGLSFEPIWHDEPTKVAVDPWAPTPPPKPAEKSEPTVKIAVVPGEQ